MLYAVVLTDIPQCDCCDPMPAVFGPYETILEAEQVQTILERRYMYVEVVEMRTPNPLAKEIIV